tara:strand:- start:1079 stop:1279 length:201 start_codon:yes stop_codon:yes gene_type:complete
MKLRFPNIAIYLIGAGLLPLPPGHHEFNFIVDGQWCCEPGCEGEHRGCLKCCANAFGTMNRVLEVS